MERELKPYTDALRALPFVQDVAIAKKNATPDVVLRLRTRTGWHLFPAEIKTTPPNNVVAARLLAKAERPFLLLTPYVTPTLADILTQGGLGFVDLAGNIHLAVGDEHLFHVQGRKPRPAERKARGLGAGGYQALFAILAKPELIGAPVRDIAVATGVGKTIVAELLRRLEDEGWLARRKGRVVPLRPLGGLIDRWLTGYADVLRPKLLIGRYRGNDEQPTAIERRIERTLDGKIRWCFGGAAAAFRLTKHYRGETTVLHVERPVPDLTREIRVLPAADGPLVLVRAPGPVGFAGPKPHTAHPLLVYTELLLAGGEREREAAADVRERYLGYL
jgi:hypothetical protein